MDRVVSSERTYEIRHFYDKLSWFPIAELLSILHFVKLSWFPISEYLTILHVFRRSSLKVLIKKSELVVRWRTPTNTTLFSFRRPQISASSRGGNYCRTYIVLLFCLFFLNGQCHKKNRL